MRTPRYYGQFALYQTRLIRTPVNADSGHLSLAQDHLAYVDHHYQLCAVLSRSLLKVYKPAVDCCISMLPALKYTESSGCVLYCNPELF